MQSLYTTLTAPLLSLGSDKYLHAILSALIAFALTLAFGWWIAALITLYIGVMKELIIDYGWRCTRVDWQDILADAVGTAMGTLMAIL